MSSTREQGPKPRSGRVVFTRPSAGRTDGPKSYGPRGPADENDPEAHIFRGED